MPGRQAHGGLPSSKKPKPRDKHKKRSLNAYAIAAQENPDRVKIRSHRLGEYEDDIRPAKRVRASEDDDDEETEESRAKKARNGRSRRRPEDSDVEEGSDSEGHEWRLGEVGSDDDSELDSDEAFGESDEERFEGFAFSGSTKKNTKPAKQEHMHPDTFLDEDEGSQEDSDDDSLGEDAVDLATMLDATEGDSSEELKQVPREEDESDARTYDEDDEESDDESSIFSMDASDDDDPHKLAALQDLVANLPQSEASVVSTSARRNDSAIEHNTPSEFGIAPRTKLTLEDLGIPSVADPHLRKSVKLLETEARRESTREGNSQKLAVPLAKRQQDRLNRSAAYEKTKETLKKWNDTVAHNRRAEHLVFPLPDQDQASMHNNKQLQPATTSKPFNDLEVAIQNILEESGLATADGKDAEDKIREFEELKTKKLSLEEVKARTAELRQARDLLFREEARAKRVKKIKSKTYRKVHRKQREKEERMNRDALLAAGIDPSDDEHEKQDRQRALERVSGKHKASRWAKSVKEIGRAAWDDDARDGITEMARRGDELRKRVEDKVLRRDGIQDPESGSESDDESASDDETEGRRLLEKLDKLSGSDQSALSGPGSKLANMKFMLNAEAARKKENDHLVNQLKKELGGEISQSEDSVEGDVGRRIFGLGSKADNSKEKPKTLPPGSEFEEMLHSDEEIDAAIGISNDAISSGIPIPTKDDIKTVSTSRRGPQVRKAKSTSAAAASNTVDSSHESGAWSKALSSGSGSQRRKKNSTADAEVLDLSNVAMLAKSVKSPKATKTKEVATLDVPDDNDSVDSDEGETIHLPFAIKDQEMIKRAFAGADVVGEFEAEKRQTVEDEDDKIVDDTLPGWGNWVGDGLSNREKARNKGRFLTKVEGIKAQDRKDAKLKRVIINEKRVKKNAKYLASSLPHPYESRAQYERALRMPLGPEWGTKETFQNATKPRILLKQGIITPMSKPLL